MQQPLQITYRGVEPSDAIERRIRNGAEELERFSDEIVGCRVTVEWPHKHQHKGGLYAVRIELQVPERTLVVSTEQHNDPAHFDVYVALRDAFGAAVRQLEDYARTRRGQIKRHQVPGHGRVTRLFRDDGHGFVELSDGTEVYFHQHSVPDQRFATLALGDEVRVVLAEGEGEKGPQASSVVPLGKHHVVGRPTD